MSRSVAPPRDLSTTADSPAATPARGDHVLRVVAVVAIALAGLTFLASRFRAPLPGPPGGRLLPRVPRPPATAGEVLRMLGVGSLVWYTAFLSAPIFAWVARRAPLERGRWLTGVAA